MTPDERRNERLKLTANWLNTLAAGVITAGTFVPAAQFIFNLLPPTTDLGLVYGVGLVCIPVGFAIHSLGQLILEGLR